VAGAAPLPDLGIAMPIKDVNMMLDAAGAVGVEPAFGRALAAQLERARALGLSHKDWSRALLLALASRATPPQAARPPVSSAVLADS
jgi:3-hydroxyisobutyrate dehydrogenase-like beta-hydroxyacid dehydrogenase